MKMNLTLGCYKMRYINLSNEKKRNAQVLFKSAPSSSKILAYNSIEYGAEKIPAFGFVFSILSNE